MQGDVFEVEDCTDTYYVDTGMYEEAEYGSVYLIDAERPALVDTGTGTNYDRILKLLDAVGLARSDLEYILVTHVHLDHAGGAGLLAEECPNADVYVHQSASRHLIEPRQIVEGTKNALGDHWKYHVEPKPIPGDRITELEDGDTINLGDRVLDVHHAPGHAPHQVVFHDRLNDAVFAADAAGAWIPALETVHMPSPPPDFDLEQVLEDARMIANLDPETLLFGHFGPCQSDVQDVLADCRAAAVEWIEAVKSKADQFDTEDEIVEYFISENEFSEVWSIEQAEANTAMNVRGALVYLSGPNRISVLESPDKS